jgi:EAL domain-containing protein (putative c-di-GMP-specific phosphodiesterase class I)
MEVLVTRNKPARVSAPRRPRGKYSMPLSEIHAALTGAMIEPRYQPIVRLTDRKPVAVEVLARLNHPTRGLMQPNRFIPQMETAGLGPALTEVVALRAFADMTGLALAPQRLDIAVNLPLDVLLMPQALALLDKQRQREGIAAGQVIIELTESRPVEDVPALQAATTRLRETGYQVVIDDVEPMVPRLEELLTLPFSGIKLDKTVVGRIVADTASHDFVARMVDKAKSRGLTVTAEGVENVPTWDRLAGLGVDLAQGFLIARPIVADSVPDWLRRWSKRWGLAGGPPARSAIRPAR